MFDATPNNGVDKLDQVRATPPLPDNPDIALAGTEDEVALDFARRHDGDLRYVNPWHQWLRWAGDCWQRIDDLSVFHAVRRVAREFAKLHQDKKLGKDAATAAIERIARNDPRHDTPADAWDLNSKIFNTHNRSAR
jgi:putative DNA primase/helicase